MSGGHLYAVPDHAAADAVRRLVPGCSVLVTMPDAAWGHLLRVGRIRRPSFVGWLPDGPVGVIPASGEIARRGGSWMVRFEDLPRFKTLRPVSAGPRHVVFQRRGAGLGDIVSALGGIETYAAEHPGALLHLDSVAPIAAIAEHHPALHRIHTDPATVPAEATVICMGLPHPPAIERDQHARRTLNRTEMFASMMGVSRPAVPRIYLQPAERAWAAEWLQAHRFTAGKFLVLVWRCRDRYKDYVHVARLYQRLRLSQEVLILEHSQPTPGPSTHGLSIRQQAALIAEARLVCTPDTGWLHVAGALRKPIFGLYGSQNGALRQAAYPVPGGWMQGPCPHGRQPCVERTCRGRSEYQPCLYYSAASAEARILETLEAIP